MVVGWENVGEDQRRGHGTTWGANVMMQPEKWVAVLPRAKASAPPSMPTPPQQAKSPEAVLSSCAV